MNKNYDKLIKEYAILEERMKILQTQMRAINNAIEIMKYQQLGVHLSKSKVKDNPKSIKHVKMLDKLKSNHQN